MKKIFVAGVLIVVLLPIVFLTSCNKDKITSGENKTQEIIVFAAASLTESFTEIAANGLRIAAGDKSVPVLTGLRNLVL